MSASSRRGLRPGMICRLPRSLVRINQGSSLPFSGLIEMPRSYRLVPQIFPRMIPTPLHIVCSVAALSAILPLQSKTQDALAYERLKLDDQFYAEGATFADINRDGSLDIVAGPFWYEGPSFSKRHEIYPPKPFDPLKYSENFFAYTDDFDGDGWLDVLVIGFPGADASWYRNPGKAGGHWEKHLAFSPVDNESAMYVDLTGDGKAEVVCSSGGKYGYAVPDREHPTKPWTFHPVSAPGPFQRFTHGLGVGDVNGDGRPDLLDKGGWWQQPASLEGDPVWKRHTFPFSSGRGGAQMCVVDLNGDGLPDVATSMDAHGYGLSWFEQIRTPDGGRSFRERVILSTNAEEKLAGVQFSQLHALALVDLNGDGIPDLVSGKRWWAHGPNGDADPNGTPVVYAFVTRRDASGVVTFTPVLLDDDSGIGTQLIYGDVNNDQRPDFITANKRGTFLLRSK